MKVLHDLRCGSCQHFMADQLVDPTELPACEDCGGETGWVPSRMHTDLFATPQYSDATGKWHGSQRQKESAMREKGYEPCGDKQGGARPSLRIEGTRFSYAGQVRRS